MFNQKVFIHYLYNVKYMIQFYQSSVELTTSSKESYFFYNDNRNTIAAALSI